MLYSLVSPVLLGVLAIKFGWFYTSRRLSPCIGTHGCCYPPHIQPYQGFLTCGAIAHSHFPMLWRQGSPSHNRDGPGQHPWPYRARPIYGTGVPCPAIACQCVYQLCLTDSLFACLYQTLALLCLRCDLYTRPRRLSQRFLQGPFGRVETAL